MRTNMASRFFESLRSQPLAGRQPGDGAVDAVLYGPGVSGEPWAMTTLLESQVYPGATITFKVDVAVDWDSGEPVDTYYPKTVRLWRRCDHRLLWTLDLARNGGYCLMGGDTLRVELPTFS